VESDKELQQCCIQVRIDVFVHEQGFPLDVEIDAYDLNPGTIHFLLRLTPSQKPIGVIRGTRLSEAYYKLSRLAVLKDYRQFKFGRELVEALHDWVKLDALEKSTANAAKVVCHSQLPVKGFYAKFGYIPEGAEFDEDGDPHQKMVLEIPLR